MLFVLGGQVRLLHPLQNDVVKQFALVGLPDENVVLNAKLAELKGFLLLFLRFRHHGRFLRLGQLGLGADGVADFLRLLLNRILQRRDLFTNADDVGIFVLVPLQQIGQQGFPFR